MRSSPLVFGVWLCWATVATNRGHVLPEIRRSGGPGRGYKAQGGGGEEPAAPRSGRKDRQEWPQSKERREEGRQSY